LPFCFLLTNWIICLIAFFIGHYLSDNCFHMVVAESFDSVTSTSHIYKSTNKTKGDLIDSFFSSPLNNFGHCLWSSTVFILECTDSNTQLKKHWGTKPDIELHRKLHRKFAFRAVAFATAQQFSSIFPDYPKYILHLIFPTQNCGRLRLQHLSVTCVTSVFVHRWTFVWLMDELWSVWNLYFVRVSSCFWISMVVSFHRLDYDVLIHCNNWT